MKKFFLVCFFVASAGEFMATWLQLNTLAEVFKPGIMASLIVYYFVSNEGRSRSVVFAMCLSLLGDVLLMLQSSATAMFIYGLFAFLLSHVFYILSYRQHREQNESQGLQGVQRARFAFPFILAGTGLIVVLYPVLGDLKIPVMFYALVLILMVVSALFRYGHTSAVSFWMVFCGAVLFMVSDSVLAINKFLEPVSHSTFWIMLTYCSAQFLIVSGLLKHNAGN